MIDFPSSGLSVGEVFSAAGASWRWDGTKWVAYGGGSSGNVGRNLLHNPRFAIQQRGTGAWTSTGYTADRWFLGITAPDTATSVIAGSVIAADESIKFHYAVAPVGATNGQTAISQDIEGVSKLGGQTVTVSFYAVRSAGTGNLGVSIDQYFGTGGSPSARVNGTGQMVTVTGAWARYSVTFTLPSVAGKTLGTANNDFTALLFWYSNGIAADNIRSGGIGVQNVNIAITGVQLEIGSVATPLEKLDLAEDLARCQRFYQTGSAQLYTYGAAAGAWISTMVGLPVSMRTTPTITTNFPTNSNGSGMAMNNQGISGLMLYGAAAAAGSVNVVASYTVSADL